MDDVSPEQICHNGNMEIDVVQTARKPAKIYLRDWLSYRSMTAEGLADRLEANKGQVSKLMTGKQRYNQDWLERIAFALECEVVDLYCPPPLPGEEMWKSRLSAAVHCATAMGVPNDLMIEVFGKIIQDRLEAQLRELATRDTATKEAAAQSARERLRFEPDEER